MARMFVSSIDITVYLYISKRVFTIVRNISLGYTNVWKDKFIILIFLKNLL